MQHHKYSLYDIESMMPWERQAYVILLNNYIEEEKEMMRLDQLQPRNSRTRR